MMVISQFSTKEQLMRDGECAADNAETAHMHGCHEEAQSWYLRSIVYLLSALLKDAQQQEPK